MKNFSSKIITWYERHKRDLPWRHTRDPYTIWLSEIILQQTRVAQGTPYFFKFIKAFPTVQDLALAPIDSVLKLWQGLGYYSRARNLHAAAQWVMQENDGEFPDSYSGLLQLKGVGDYTASAIASFCYNEPAAVVDGNVYRVLSRVFGIETPVTTGKGQKEFKKLAQELLDKKQPATFNQGLMEFGSLQCTPSSPDCLTCPFNKTCVALKFDQIKTLPVKQGKVKIKHRYFNYLVFQGNQQESVLIQRTGKGIWSGLYEFPLLESNKTLLPKEIVQHHDIKKILEKQDVDWVRFRKSVLNNNTFITSFYETPKIHKLSHQHLHTQFFIIDMAAPKQETISNLKEYAVPVLIQNFANQFWEDYQ